MLANGSPSTAFYSECLTLKDKALIVAKIFASPFLRLVMATYLVENISTVDLLVLTC